MSENMHTEMNTLPHVALMSENMVNANINNVPVVCLSWCEYDRNRKILKLASEFMGMPREFFVRSHHTGKEVRFTVVNEHDVLFDQDGWDGEQCIYRPVGVVPNVDHMVIYHQW